MSPVGTALPAPTAAAFDSSGRWPHMRQLRTELAALVADLGPTWTTRGPDAVAEAASLTARSYRRLTVCVYTPLGRDEAHLGWFQAEPLGEAITRLLAHLPGSRLAEEIPRSWPSTVEWGSRTPGWSLTALRVQRTTSFLWREREQVWDANEVAAHLGIARKTWRSYVDQRAAGAPIPLGRTALVGTDGRTRLVDVWDPDRVTSWDEARPGHGGRPPAVTPGDRPQL